MSEPDEEVADIALSAEDDERVEAGSTFPNSLNLGNDKVATGGIGDVQNVG